MDKQLSVIIVTYNSKHLIYDCIDSVYNFNDIDDALEVIVVDNDSSDQEGLFEGIRKRYPHDIKLIKNKFNGGYGSGNNLGVQNCTAKYIVVMNPDVRIINPIFSKLISKFESDNEIGMLGVMYADKSFPFYFKPEYVSLLGAIMFKLYILLRLFNMNKMYMTGCFLMFEKKTFIEIGGFDENIFLFYEESDVANRILKTGKHLILAKDVEVYHLMHIRSFNDKLASIELDSLEYYLNKYQHPPKRIFKTILLMYKIKYFVASIFGFTTKKKIFKEWIDLLNIKAIKLN